MHTPPHFEETRNSELHRIIDQYSLGTLVVNGPDGLDANHLPFELDPDTGDHGHLVAHVARANPLWKEAKDGDEVLVIFRAADSYISPNWYPSKHEFHRQVPTWNYQVVSIWFYRSRLLDDASLLRQNRTCNPRGADTICALPRS